MQAQDGDQAGDLGEARAEAHQQREVGDRAEDEPCDRLVPVRGQVEQRDGFFERRPPEQRVIRNQSFICEEDVELRRALREIEQQHQRKRDPPRSEAAEICGHVDAGKAMDETIRHPARQCMVDATAKCPSLRRSRLVVRDPPVATLTRMSCSAGGHGCADAKAGDGLPRRRGEVPLRAAGLPRARQDLRGPVARRQARNAEARTRGSGDDPRREAEGVFAGPRSLGAQRLDVRRAVACPPRGAGDAAGRLLAAGRATSAGAGVGPGASR